MMSILLALFAPGAGASDPVSPARARMIRAIEDGVRLTSVRKTAGGRITTRQILPVAFVPLTRKR